MIVYHPYRLHDRVDDRGTHEVHAAVFEVIAYGVGQMEWSEKDKLAFLEHKEKILKTKLEFIHKTIESLRSEKASSKK